jgi:hypothetical protein
VAYADEVLADAPSAYMRLGEGSGTTCVDAVGGTSGAYTAPSHVAGLLPGDANGAVDFNGTTSKVQFADRAAFDFGDVFSGEAWIRPDAVSRFNGICDKGSGAPVVRIDQSDNRLLLRRNGVANIVRSTITFAAATAYYVAWSKNAGAVKLYAAIVGSALADVTGTVTNSTCVDNSTAFSIGSADAGTSDFFDGVIDELAVYKSVVSQARFEAHYAAGLASPRLMGLLGVGR